MQGLREIFRAIAIVLCAAIGTWLFIDAMMMGPGELQLSIATVLLFFAAGLTLTWFWSPFG